MPKPVVMLTEKGFTGKAEHRGRRFAIGVAVLAVSFLLPGNAWAHSAGMAILFFFLPLGGLAVAGFLKFFLIHFAWRRVPSWLSLRIIVIQIAELLIFILTFAVIGWLYVRFAPAGGPGSFYRELVTGILICVTSALLNSLPNRYLVFGNSRRAAVCGAIFPVLYLVLGAISLWMEYQS
ncbi:MAG: hypothetical protein QGH40_08915 [bacterium]|nr:hypothetical protein [bacterium]